MDAAVASGGWVRRVAALSQHRFATWALAALAFADSSFLPIPPDILLVPMALTRPERLRFLLVVCTLGSALGAGVGYLIGALMWNAIGLPLVEAYGHLEAFRTFQGWVQEWGPWIIVFKALTPIPFKIAAIGAGVVAMNPIVFLISALIGRALHFVMVGAVLAWCGPKIMAVVSRYERPVALVTILVVVGGALVYSLR